MEEIKRINRELVYKGKIVDFYKDTMAIPNGNVVFWDHLEHQGAAAVIPVLADGRIVLVRQLRNSVEKYTWEIPAGGLDGKDEPTIVAARRELAEETGFTTDEELEFLISIHTIVAYGNEKIDIYVAHGLKEGLQHLDEDEFLDVKAFTVDEIKEMIYSGKMTDAKTISAIMSYSDKYLK
ncbi:MAG: NUDIX hydrolase [Lachnospiraceae bacterium]|nr:NUDIX hydrolase [Lachnospiraceae bacterium]